MEEFKPYPAYKDSGVEWIGEIPENWGLTIVGTQYNFVNEKVSDKEFPPLSVTKEGIVPQLEIAAKTNHNDNRKKVLTDDFVINGRSDRPKACGVSNFTGSVSLINHVLRLKGESYHNNYGHHLFRNSLFSQEFYKWGKGIVDDLWSTSKENLKRIFIPLPPYRKQELISLFLDYKVKRINDLITGKERLIELLEEKRQAVITEAVIKGLDPNVKMKDSRVEWIGEIPEHWNMIKIKYSAESKSEKSLNNSGLPYLGLENVTSGTGNINTFNEESEIESQSILFEVGDVLFGKLRPYLKKCVLAPREGICSSEFLVLKTKKDFLNNRFMKYILLSDTFVETVNSSTYGAKMPRASWNFIRDINIPLPPYVEQEKIADSINETMENIDKLKQQILNQITKLQEYRESLIYEAVTGKIDVRDYATEKEKVY